MPTAVEAAQHICLSPSRFRDLVAQGVIARKPASKYSLTKVREAYIKHMQKVAAGRGSDGGKALSERRARLADLQGDAVELKNAVARGDYVLKDVMVEVVRQDYMVVRNSALAMAGKLSDRLSGRVYTRAEVSGVITGEVHEWLTDLSKPERAEHLASGDDGDGSDDPKETT
jgi:hypothetical protein